MMILLLLLPFLSFSLDLNSEVNWWNTQMGDKKTISKPKRESKKEISADRLFKDSIKWFEEKLKKEKPPVEYYFFLDPNNPIYREAYIKWLQWKAEKARQIIYSSLGGVKNANTLNVTEREVIRWLKQRNYKFLFFYNRECPYCKADFPEVEKIAKHFDVFWIEIHSAPQMFAKWRISATPTLIAVSPQEKKAVRWEGYFRYPDVLFFFYQKLVGTRK